MSKRWPRTMPVLKPRDFFHGAWAVGPKESPWTDDVGFEWIDEVPPSKTPCGTRCCLVGHVRHAFGLPADPGCGGDLPAQGAEFLRTFLSEAGYDPGYYNEDMDWLTTYASDCFEGIGGHKRLTPRKAANAWARTLKRHGYTEDA